MVWFAEVSSYWTSFVVVLDAVLFLFIRSVGFVDVSCK